jgi:hypothetical protein
MFKKNDNDKSKIIKTLVRQTSRWATAAAQDENILISVLHANYGAGYLYALRDIATDEEIVNTTGIDVLQFRDAVTQVQDYSTKRLMELCPNFAPKASYLSKVASEI